MMYRLCYIYQFLLFNENRSCIEIWMDALRAGRAKTFNENRSCIEIEIISRT